MILFSLTDLRNNLTGVLETLNILLDDTARESLFAGLKDLEDGNVLPVRISIKFFRGN